MKLKRRNKFKSRLIIRDLSTRDFESFVIHIWMNYPCVFCERQTFKTLKIDQKHFQNTVEKFFRKHCGLRSVFFFLVFFFPLSVYSIKVPQTRIKSFKRIWLRAKQRSIRTHRIPSIFIPHERLGPLPNSVSASRWFHCRWFVMQNFIVVNEMGYFT